MNYGDRQKKKKLIKQTVFIFLIARFFVGKGRLGKVGRVKEVEFPSLTHGAHIKGLSQQLCLG